MIPLLLATQVVVRCDATCPSTAAISSRLETLLPKGDAPTPDQADVAAGPDGIVIALRKPDGVLVAWRKLAWSGSCDDMAEAAAVVLAAWETRPRAGWESVGPIDVGADPTRPSAGNDRPPTRPSVERRSPEVGIADRDAGLPLVRDLEVGAAGMEVWSPGSHAPGVLVDASARVKALRLRIGGLFVSQQRTDFAGGFATWSRAGAVAGVEVAFGQRGPFVALRAELVASMLSVAGESFSVNRTVRSFDPGVMAGARFGFAWSAVRPYLGGGLAHWFRPQSLSVDGSGASARIPALEPRVELGLVFRVGG